MDDINKHPQDDAPHNTPKSRCDNGDDTMTNNDQHNAKKEKDSFFNKIFAKKNDGDDAVEAAENATEGEIGETSAEDEAETTEATPDLAAELAETKEKLLRLHADFDNYRKRIAREYNDVRERAKANVISDFLPVYDYFQLAMSHAEQNAEFDALMQGMHMILAEFKRTFDNLGAEEINATGKQFDAKWHEAMSQEPDVTLPAGHVIRQWKSGFRLGDTLLRPATVVVSSGPPTAEAPDGDEANPETNN